jgi:small ligand-binding sensory domain FIST
MPFAAALSTQSRAERAVAEVLGAALKMPGSPELAVAFYSPHHADAMPAIADRLQRELEPRCLIGCQGEGVIGAGREIENGPALVLWLAKWDGKVELEPVHLTANTTPDGPTLFGWPDGLVESDAAKAVMLLLADPYTFPAAELFLPRVNEDYKGLRVHGGMASGMTGQGQTVLFADGEPKEEGAVGVLLRGPIGLRSVVSQGCRPVGKPLVVTKAKDNIIYELGGRPPVFHLRDLLEQLPERDRQLFQNGPHIGIAMTEYKDTFGRDDFLVRNLHAMDPSNGAIAITDRARAGQTVQFLIRDAGSADEDFRELLHDSAKTGPGRPQSALLFTCNGRGTRLFGSPNHDAGAIAEECGDISCAGFFAAGELGPVGGTNYLHGFTASTVLFDG